MTEELQRRNQDLGEEAGRPASARKGYPPPGRDRARKNSAGKSQIESSAVNALRAAELAAKAIDGVIPSGTPVEQRKVRKRKILKGPSAVRNVRRDKA